VDAHHGHRQRVPRPDLPAFQTWLQGRIPEWSDLLWGGYPLIGDSTGAPLYPLHFVPYLATLGAPLRFFDVAFALHLGLFAREPRGSSARSARAPGATVLAGVLGALCRSPTTAASCSSGAGRAGLVAVDVRVAERLAKPATPTLGRIMVLGWIALAAQVLVGVPEQATYCAIVASVWLLTRRSPLSLGARIARPDAAGRRRRRPRGAAASADAAAHPDDAAGRRDRRGVRFVLLSPPLRFVVPGVGADHSIPAFLGVAALVLASSRSSGGSRARRS
jgi:hypothetical protein